MDKKRLVELANIKPKKKLITERDNNVDFIDKGDSTNDDKCWNVEDPTPALESLFVAIAGREITESITQIGRIWVRNESGYGLRFARKKSDLLYEDE